MKNFIVISIFFTFLFNGVTVYSAEPEEDCDKNQATMNRCAESEFVELDNELNSLYKQKMETLKSREYRKYLKIAEIAWIEFRDKDCMYQLGPPQDRGSIHIMRKYKCMSKHTSRRIEDLKAYILIAPRMDALISRWNRRENASAFCTSQLGRYA